MTSLSRLLELLVRVEVTIALVVIIALFAVALVARRRRRAMARTMGRGREIVQEAVLDRPRMAEEVRSLSRLPTGVRVRLFVDLSSTIAGAGRERAARIGHEIGLDTVALEMCRSRAWYRRLRGIRLCTLLGIGHDEVPPLLRDPKFSVRAEAVDWAGEQASAEMIPTLVDFLAEPDYVGGYTLRDALLRIGPPVIPHLHAYLMARKGEETLAALDVATGLASVDFLDVAVRLSHDDVPEVRARAASLIGAVGGQPAASRLVEMLDDPHAEAQAAAAAALGRLGEWGAAPRVGTLLRSPEWSVRTSAALALRRLGAPGLLVLRGRLTDEDRFARDIARQILDLPAGAAEAEAWG